MIFFFRQQFCSDTKLALSDHLVRGENLSHHANRIIVFCAKRKHRESLVVNALTAALHHCLVTRPTSCHRRIFSVSSNLPHTNLTNTRRLRRSCASSLRSTRRKPKPKRAPLLPPVTFGHSTSIESGQMCILDDEPTIL